MEKRPFGIRYPLKGYVYGTVNATSEEEALRLAKDSLFDDIGDLELEYVYEKAELSEE